ncbi:MAG: cell wall hydrolase [Alphaproteobacteria bacterium]|nr:cell wall hydrolase [Alphaproteobacteria bacterium]USO07992.1 MAG: cell wall hydrolase [Rhodospirillales bacterium]
MRVKSASRVSLCVILAAATLAGCATPAMQGDKKASASNHSAIATHKDKLCLLGTTAREARGEPKAGIAAVMKVIINRKRAAFGGKRTACGVVYAEDQFQGAASGSGTPKVQEVFNDLDNIHTCADRALHFHALYVNPRWNRRFLCRIGNHKFYAMRDPQGRLIAQAPVFAPIAPAREALDRSMLAIVTPSTVFDTMPMPMAVR